MPKFWVTALLVASFSVCVAAQAKTDKAAAEVGKVAGFVKNCGYANTSPTKGVWLVETESGSIVVATGPDLIVAFMTIAKKPEYKVNVEALSQMLKLGHELDHVKFIMDEEGNLVIRSEARIRTLDQASFNDTIVRVFDGFQKAAPRITPHLVKVK
jgi:hypothetical protein